MRRPLDQGRWLHRVNKVECVEGLRRVGDSLHLVFWEALSKRVQQADWMAPSPSTMCDWSKNNLTVCGPVVVAPVGT